MQLPAVLRSDCEAETKFLFVVLKSLSKDPLEKKHNFCPAAQGLITLLTKIKVWLHFMEPCVSNKDSVNMHFLTQ